MSVPTDTLDPRRCAAAARFDEHEGRQDGAQFVGDLVWGLQFLADEFFSRLAPGAKPDISVDSMLISLSTIKAESQAHREVELFQIAESSAMVRNRQWVRSPEWFQEWLCDLRLGDAPRSNDAETLARYAPLNFEERKRLFSDAVVRVFPKARKAPLVLFQLFPLAVVIATALPFGDHLAAGAARQKQVELLSVIGDCKRCQGRVLDVGESCQTCGNPLWKTSWLTAE